MEPISLAAGILPLFSVCLEYFHLFKTAQSSLADSQSLLLELDFEHERFIIWGEKNDLFVTTKPGQNSETRSRLHHVQTRDKVNDALGQIKALFDNAEDLRSRYGVDVAPPSSTLDSQEDARNSKFPSTAALNRLNWFKKRAEIGGPTAQKLNILAKTRWAFYDKAKFESLVLKVRVLINGLYSILQVSDAERDHIARQDIMALLPHIERLRLVAAASEKSYPAWSGAASAIVDASEAGSVFGDRRTMISEWVARQVGGTEGVVAAVKEGSIKIMAPPSGQNTASKLNLGSESNARRLFVFTHECESESSGFSCDDEGLEILKQGPNFIRSNDADQNSGLGKRITKSLDARVDPNLIESLKNEQLGLSYEAYELLINNLYPLKKAFVYTSACRSAIHAALQLCRGQQSKKVQWITRVDNRIPVSCCVQTQKLDRLNNVRQTLNYSEMQRLDSISELDTYSLSFIDRVWLENSILRLEEGEIISDWDGIEKLLQVHSAEDEASIFILEAGACGWIIRTPPFPKSSRMPRENEIFSFAGGKEEYLGTFVGPSDLPATARADYPRTIENRRLLKQAGSEATTASDPPSTDAVTTTSESVVFDAIAGVEDKDWEDEDENEESEVVRSVKRQRL